AGFSSSTGGFAARDPLPPLAGALAARRERPLPDDAGSYFSSPPRRPSRAAATDASRAAIRSPILVPCPLAAGFGFSPATLASITPISASRHASWYSVASNVPAML